MGFSPLGFWTSIGILRLLDRGQQCSLQFPSPALRKLASPKISAKTPPSAPTTATTCSSPITPTANGRPRAPPRPPRSRFVIITSPGGPYFAQPIRLLAEETYVRAFPGGTGDAKTAGNYGGGLLAAKLAQAKGYHNVMWLDGKDRPFIEESGGLN